MNNADVSIERNEAGTTIEVDSDVVDVTYHKDQEGNVKIDVEIDDKVIYEFVSNGASKHMPKAEQQQRSSLNKPGAFLVRQMNANDLLS